MNYPESQKVGDECNHPRGPGGRCRDELSREPGGRVRG